MPDRILLGQLGAHGDCLYATILARQLRRDYPSAFITWAISDRSSGLLANNPDYKFVIEAHTDNKGTPDEVKTLTQERAQAIADRLMSLGVEQSRIEAKGLGATLPIAPNTTNINRAKNRRIDVILVPNVN